MGVRLVWARFERSVEGNLLEYDGARAGCPALRIRIEKLKESNRVVDALHTVSVCNNGILVKMN